MPQCAIAGCNSTHRKTKGGSVRYHRFPGDSRTRTKWLEACGKPLNNCATARICSRHFSGSSYERDVQHELLGLPTRCRLKRGAVPDQNLPDDFLKEEVEAPESAIAVLLAVGLVPVASEGEEGVVGGLPQDLNKMQIMEDVREGCDVVHPPSPGHADDRGVDESQAVKKENINQNGTNSSENEEERCKETVVKEETIDKSDGECEDKNKDTTPVSENHKRKLDEDDTPLKRLKSEIQENFASRDKIFNDFIEITQSNNLEQITVLSEQTLSEIKALNEMAKEKEREWNHLIHLKKLKEELLIRLQRKRQVIVLNDTNLGDIALDGLSQQSVLKSNQKTNILRSSLDKPVQKGNFPKSQFDINSALDFRQKQRPILDVQSIIADYRQKHPESVPRRGRRIRHPQCDGKTSILGFSGGNYSVNQKVSDAPNDMGLLLNTINGSRENSRSSQPDPTFGQDVTSFKDILVQFAKLSQNEKNELQMHLQHVSRPPPPYPEVTVHPVSTTNTVAPTNSLLHGILTNTATKQHHQNNGSSNVPNGNSKTSFSPTLARLLTAPERCGSNHMISTPTISTGGLLQGSNMSISEILSTSKARNEITITPVSGQYESSSKEESIVEEECEEGVDRLVIDESSEVLSCRKDDTSSDAGDDVPQCQGCNQKAAQFVCAGCGNQWYCSRDCQVAAWDEHSEVCSG
ncbi:uncharacterized protein LOC132698839 isoform X2 [Cylas formicarius]|uniref:uncharacterized protein LOC132698839 isoform X2 n=1 Tax=Cylas formicarius TaxID=197179 RepID=UPI002958ADE5|nr:uncharacterized protein LOC132698839 isoform X2 [Cylas formicarius]XP_060521156.1 uncharacterized protein LOC132698839 isoform X2 [Cylas formicarius]XP_060521157.1 uncharacterized protein LOC132698839 isoform X2 [Cylas formicarius]